MAATVGLRLESSISVPTANGHYEIQLLFGDITKLRALDKVDILMVSAFPGNYNPVPTTLIGALLRNLNIDVRELARNKAEDLRRNFHCWLSHDLPPSLPYKRLLCFERAFHELAHPAVLVGDVFRALVPTFKNEESTVITPILASGNQNFPRTTMLKAMVDAAVHWMQAGLPLACLKVVVFTRDLNKPNPDPEVTERFKQLKSKWETSKTTWRQSHTIKYDVYLSYSIHDMEYVQRIIKQLRAEKEDIRIFSEKQELNMEDAWQDNIFQLMITCIRVVTILTPHYLESSECLEQYNIALCCNRLIKRDILAPFYVVQVPEMPTYMQLMQYIDFRTRTITVDGITKEETFEEKIGGSCQKFITLLTHNDALTHRVSDRMVSYDVFISYAHRDVKLAEHILGVLSRLNSKMTVFFDRKELRTGSSWQQALYNALDGSKVVVALLSPSYVTSAICQEEYNLALALHAMMRTEVIPVLIKPISTVPRSFTHIPIISATDRFEEVAMKICKAVATYIQFQTKMDVFSPIENVIDVDQILERNREKFFAEHFRIQKNKICKKKSTCEQREQLGDSKWGVVRDTLESNAGYDIVFSCVPSDQKYAVYMEKYLHRRNPGLKISLGADTDIVHLQNLEKSKLVVALVSPHYLRSPQGKDEFHIAVCKHRSTKGVATLYPLQVAGLLPRPSFGFMIPCHVSCSDPLWKLIQFYAEVGRVCEKLESEVIDKILQEGTFNDSSMLTEDMSAACQGQIGLQLRHTLALTTACEDILDVLGAKR